MERKDGNKNFLKEACSDIKEEERNSIWNLELWQLSDPLCLHCCQQMLKKGGDRPPRIFSVASCSPGGKVLCLDRWLTENLVENTPLVSRSWVGFPLLSHVKSLLHLPARSLRFQ